MRTKHSVIDIQAAIKKRATNLSQKSHAIYREKLLPGAQKGTKLVKDELVKIHKKQNLFKIFKKSFVVDSIGLLFGMLSANFVSQFFEVRSLNNLWGIFSRHTIVSENTYIAICFTVEFTVALVVFTLTAHYMDELKQWRKRNRQDSLKAAEVA